MEREDATATRVRVIAIRKPGLSARGLVDERERIDGRIEPVREPLDVLAALVLDLDQRLALGLGLDHPSGLAIEEQQIVDPAVRLAPGRTP